MGTLHDIIIIVCFCHSKHVGLELPQINYRACRGKKYRYVYGIGDFNFVDGEKVSLTNSLFQQSHCTFAIML